MFEAVAWRVLDVNYVRRCIIRLREVYSWLYAWRRKRVLFVMRCAGLGGNWKLGQRVVT
jgi:hypothetical protein